METTTIAEAAEQCVKELTRCLQVETLLGNEWAENRLADVNLWIWGIGAFASERASLDSRLASRPEARDVITNFLRLLAGEIQKCRIQGESLESPQGSDKDSTCVLEDEPPPRSFSPWSDDSSSDDQSEDLQMANPITIGSGPLYEAMTNVESMLDQLIRIGVLVRQSGRRARVHKADQRFDATKYQELRDYLVNMLPPKYPPKPNPFSALTEVQQRVINSNLKRRNRFLYAQQHSRKLEADDMPRPTRVFTLEQPMPTREVGSIDQGLQSVSMAKKQQPEATVRTTISGTSASKVSDSFPLEQIDIPASAGSSMISTTILNLQYPCPPRIKAGSHVFRCPCCCETLPAFTAGKVRWKKHLAGDISPYTCVLQGCDQPDVLFNTRDEWQKHLLEEHRSITSWTCLACDDGTQFDSEEDFIRHTLSFHADTITKDQIPVLLGLSKRSTQAEIKYCPLCNWPDGENSPADPDVLLDHIAKEIHHFSLLSLPWNDYNGQESDERVDLSSDKVCHWLSRNPPFGSHDQELPVREKRTYYSEYFQRNDYFAENSVDSSSDVSEDGSIVAGLQDLKNEQGALSVDSDGNIEDDHMQLHDDEFPRLVNLVQDQKVPTSGKDPEDPLRPGLLSDDSLSEFLEFGLGLYDRIISWDRDENKFAPPMPFEVYTTAQDIRHSFSDLNVRINGSPEWKMEIEIGPWFEEARSLLYASLVSLEDHVESMENKGIPPERMMPHLTQIKLAINRLYSLFQLPLPLDTTVATTADSGQDEGSSSQNDQPVQPSLLQVIELGQLVCEQIATLCGIWQESRWDSIVQRVVTRNSIIRASFKQLHRSISTQVSVPDIDKEASGVFKILNEVQSKLGGYETMEGSSRKLAAQELLDWLAYIQIMVERSIYLFQPAPVSPSTDLTKTTTQSQKLPWSKSVLRRIIGREPNSRSSRLVGQMTWMSHRFSEPDLLERAIPTASEANAKFPDALLGAANDGQLNAVKLFIGAGADVNAADSRGQTALLEAAGRGHLGVVNLLLNEGADLEATGFRGQTALLEAAGGGYVDVVKRLLAEGADPNSPGSRGQTALQEAVRFDSLPVVQRLLAAGADPNAIGFEGQTALQVAANWGYLSIVKKLLAAGAFPNEPGSRGHTALQEAAKYGHFEVVESLLKSGADVNATDSKGRTAVYHAAMSGHSKIMDMLIDAGASVQARPRDLTTTRGDRRESDASISGTSRKVSYVQDPTGTGGNTDEVARYWRDRYLEGSDASRTDSESGDHLRLGTPSEHGQSPRLGDDFEDHQLVDWPDYRRKDASRMRRIRDRMRLAVPFASRRSGKEKGKDSS